jgi:acyl-coenzyme A synthetase/AMP-(fatty) acid ligase
VPTAWAQLVAFLERHPEQRGPIARLRRAVASGEQLPAAVAGRLRAVAGVELLDCFGSAECGDIVIGRRPGEPLRGVGRAAPGVDLRLEDEAGGAPSAGTPGRLLVRCPTATLGYWERPGETAELYDEGWLRTGDLMSRCGGVFRSHGRADDLLKVGGQWLRPAEAEACLYEHQAVVEAAVVGIRSRYDGDGAAVFVAVRESPVEGLTGDLRRILARQVGRGAASAPVTLVDRLPRLASGKLDRRALVEMAAA